MWVQFNTFWMDKITGDKNETKIKRRKNVVTNVKI